MKSIVLSSTLFLALASAEARIVRHPEESYTYKLNLENGPYYKSITEKCGLSQLKVSTKLSETPQKVIFPYDPRAPFPNMLKTLIVSEVDNSECFTDVPTTSDMRDFGQKLHYDLTTEIYKDLQYQVSSKVEKVVLATMGLSSDGTVMGAERTEQNLRLRALIKEVVKEVLNEKNQ